MATSQWFALWAFANVQSTPRAIPSARSYENLWFDDSAGRNFRCRRTARWPGQVHHDESGGRANRSPVGTRSREGRRSVRVGHVSRAQRHSGRPAPETRARWSEADTTWTFLPPRPTLVWHPRLSFLAGRDPGVPRHHWAENRTIAGIGRCPFWTWWEEDP